VARCNAINRGEMSHVRRDFASWLRLTKELARSSIVHDGRTQGWFACGFRPLAVSSRLSVCRRPMAKDDEHMNASTSLVSYIYTVVPHLECQVFDTSKALKAEECQNTHTASCMKWI